MASLVANTEIFTTLHIALTGALSGFIAAIITLSWLRGEGRTIDALAVGMLTAGAVVMLRKSANLPSLNTDGLRGFSANDLLAPIVTFVVVGLYAAFRPPRQPRRFEQARAAATIIAFAVNVVTI